jgi:hypothetical protein
MALLVFVPSFIAALSATGVDVGFKTLIFFILLQNQNNTFPAQ